MAPKGTAPLRLNCRQANHCHRPLGHCHSGPSHPVLRSTYLASESVADAEEGATAGVGVKAVVAAVRKVARMGATKEAATTAAGEEEAVVVVEAADSDQQVVVLGAAVVGSGTICWCRI